MNPISPNGKGRDGALRPPRPRSAGGTLGESKSAELGIGSLSPLLVGRASSRAVTGTRLLSLLFAIFLGASGCASHKNKNDEQFRRAYAAGAAAAQMQMQQSQTQQPMIPPAGDPQIRVLGSVKNPVLIWSEGLTLARALVLADYQRNSPPSAITIYRNNQPLQIDPQAVLAGADFPLYPGDLIYIQD
jgi:hypothetical protein